MKTLITVIAAATLIPGVASAQAHDQLMRSHTVVRVQQTQAARRVQERTSQSQERVREAQERARA